MVVPEKTSRVRKLIVPNWILRVSLIGLFFIVSLTLIMFFDYWYVIDQISENKELKIENRRLRQQVQIFQNKMANIEATMDRVETFATRLKVITNVEDRDDLVARLNSQPLPDSATNIGKKSPAALASQEEELDSRDPVQIQLQSDQDRLDLQFTELNHKTFMTEQILQDLYELLTDQKAFLAALPTRKPAPGYFSSGFGVRRDPMGRAEKMHEGLDIANSSGTLIRASAHGVVKFAGGKPGYGQTIVVDHGYGLETWYAHLKRILIKKGQSLRRGDNIALMGSTGNRSTGPHLHYEVRVYGIPVDPLTYVLEN